MLRRFGLLLGPAALLFCACSAPSDDPAASDIPTPSAIPTLEISGVAAPKADDDDRPPLRAEDLDPVVAAVAAPGVQPREIVVQFARRVVDDDALGEAGDETVLTLAPEVGGTLVWRTPRTLVFTPADVFSPGTRYSAAIEALETRDGVLKPPGGAAWSTTFTAPEAAVLGMRLVSNERETPYRRDPFQRVTLAVDFSGPVTSAQVISAVDVRLDGRRVVPKVRVGREPHHVRLELAVPEAKPGARVRLALAPGIRMGAEPLDGFLSEAVVPEDPLVDVVAVQVGEGTGGFHIDVVCDDRSVGGRNWWHDSSSYDWFEVSSRCMPGQEAAAAAITLDPPVDFTVVPARHGFRILGDFARGAQNVRIDGLVTRDGGAMAGAVRSAVSVPVRSSRVAFSTKGRYLPKSAWKSLTVRHLNVDEVELTVRHVPRRNLVFWLAGDEERADERTSDVLVKQTLAVRGDIDVETTSSIDVRGLVPDAGAGVYQVVVAAEGEADASRLLVTDLQLVAKKAATRPDEPFGRSIPVWALDAHTTKPRAGVEVEAVRRSGTILGACTTGSDGGCVIELSPDGPDDSPPVALIASTSADLTYLKFDDLRIEPTESQVAGEPYLAQTPYRVADWTDRGVYRPGETIHYAALVRDADHRAPPAEMPVTLEARDPRGNVVRSRTVQANPAGMLSWDLPLSDFASTGAWALTLAAGDEELAREVVMVEEFVPERMAATVSPAADGVVRGAPVEIDVSARYLFGGSAEGSPVELSCEIAPAPFAPEAASEWTFGRWTRPDDSSRPLALGTAVGELDRADSARLVCPGAESGFDGTGRLTARAAVFEAGSGRSTQSVGSTLIHPAGHYVGLQTGVERAGSGTTISVDGRLVDWGGALAKDAAAEAEVELVTLHEEYGWLYDEEEDTESYRRYLREIGGGATTVPVKDGVFRASVVPGADASAYLVRVTAGDAVTELRVEGTARRYWWMAGETDVDQTPRPKRPGTLVLTAPERVDVGEKAEVVFTAPYRGRALVTVETHELLESSWLVVAPGPVAHAFRAREFAPNVYVSVLLLKDPHLESPLAYVPDRAFGAQSVRVNPKAQTLPLAVSVPSEIRPNTTLPVTVNVDGVSGPTYVTVAAVDEGILQLTRFDSPDPLAEVFSARRLGVETFETVGWSLLLPPSGTSSTEGGGLDGEELGRVQMTKPVALWSGVVEIPSGGELVVPLDVPSFRGRLRVMAVAADASRMAGAGADVLVRDPLVLQPTLPRFLSRGDRIHVPVFVTNTTPDDHAVAVSLRASEIEVPGLLLDASDEGPLRVHGPATQTLSLAPGRSGTAVFDVEALASVGAGRIRVEASAAGLETSWDEVDVPFLSRGPRERRVARIPLEAAGDLDLREHLAGWVPTTEQTTFWVTTNPYGEAFDHLSYLVRYPYGCLEQTTSQTRALVHAGPFLDDVDASLREGATLASMVDHGISRMLSMQLPDGGFGYWPRADSGHTWGTAYALHTLLEAADGGHDVPRVSIDRGLEWLERTLPQRTDPRRLHHGDAYAHYVLALADRGRLARARTLLAEMPPQVRGAQSERAYLLKAALWLAGDRRHEHELKSPDLGPVRRDERSGRRFYSDLRFRGVQLSVITDLFGDAESRELERLVAASVAGRRSSRLTTQEMAWALSGLAKRQTSRPAAFGVPVLTANGRVLDPTPTARKKEDSSRSWTLARASEYRELTLTLPSKGDGALYLLVSSEGVREDASWTDEDRGVAVSRYWASPTGAKLPGDVEPELGDLMHVVLVVRNLYSAPITNLAVVDRLPAGFEIENPRLGRDAVTDVPGDPFDVAAMNLRDDRVELFGDLPGGGVRAFSYAVRAVTAGTFTAPPAQAEAMYDPDVLSTDVAGTVRVRGPWDPEPAALDEEDDEVP